jgi:hypothetical protein
VQHRLNLKLVGLAGIGACLIFQSSARADDSGENIVVVSSRVSDGYVRTKLSNGSYQPESYAFGNGGHMTGAVSDSMIDNLTFMDVAQSIAGPLARQSYVPAKDPKTTRQLVMVYWGRTRTSERLDDSVAAQALQQANAKATGAKSALKEQQAQAYAKISAPIGPMVCGRFDPTMSASLVADQIDEDNSSAGALALVAAENRSREQIDARNASLLGYDSWWAATEGSKGTSLEHRRQDMIDELEQDRYFVILMAYDFQAIWKQKKHLLLWETRLSVRQRGVDFDKQLPLIVQNASRYFGRDSHGLIHEDIPAGHVDIGALQSLGPVAEK